jgi:hypothetical protein
MGICFWSIYLSGPPSRPLNLLMTVRVLSETKGSILAHVGEQPRADVRTYSEKSALLFELISFEHVLTGLELRELRN